MSTKPLIMVAWNDAQDFDAAWAGSEAITAFGERECLIKSVGYQVSKGPKYLTLAADWHEDEDDYGRITKIPVAWVVSITNLEPLTFPTEQ